MSTAPSKVLDFPIACTSDTLGFLEAVVEDMQAGRIPEVCRGVLIVSYEDGGFSAWGFGPKNGGDYTRLALCHLGTEMFVDKLLGQ